MKFIGRYRFVAFSGRYTQLLFLSPEMGKSAQLSFASKISGEFFVVAVKFLQISKFFGLLMDKIRPDRKKMARNF
jgi:hypothetical protein